MAIGDSPEMIKMQEDAIRRAREMYERSHPAPENDDDEIPEPTHRSPHPDKEAHTEAHNSAEPASETENVIDNLFKDKEKTLILLLLVLLSDSGNNELLFSLLFLLM